MRTVLPVLPALLAAGPAGAQRRAEAPRRPALAAEADTNDACAGFRPGRDLLESRPAEAADAFYPASQIEPGWADPLYGRRPAPRRTPPSLVHALQPTPDRPMPYRFLLAALLALAAVPAGAQRRGEAPRRPALPAAADTNDARAYMALGEQRLLDRPREAADAFYWAYQINPTLGDALYGRYTALLMSNPARLVQYWEGERRTLRQPEVLAIDSLYFRALTADPFLYRRFEAPLFRLYLETWVRQELDRSGRMDVTEGRLRHAVQQEIIHGTPYVRARDAYSRGRFNDAVALYTEAIAGARQRSRAWLRAERGRLHAHMRSYAPALADMTQSLEEMRRQDQRDLVYLYESKALMEHGIGVLHERMGNLAAAREAYGRALTEELSFYPAHVRLATLALTEGDTATAIAEYDLAAQTGADPSVLYVYGAVLAQAGRYDEAAAQFERAIAAAPFYADPYFGLGMVRDAQGSGPAAVEAFRAFLDRATRTHGRRAHAEQRVQVLAAAAGAS